MLCLWSSGAMTHLDLNVFGIKLHLAWSISAAIIGIAALHSAPPYTIHPWEQRTPLWQWPLGYPVRGEGGKEKTDYFHAWVSGACITISPTSSRLGPCQLDLKWSRSEATARSCGFPLTLMPGVMPQEPCNIICFSCHLMLLANSFYMPIYTKLIWFFHIPVKLRSLLKRHFSILMLRCIYIDW